MSNVVEAIPASFDHHDARAALAFRLRGLLMTEPVVDGVDRESLVTAAYRLSIALEWVDVRIATDGLTPDCEAELLALAAELAVIEHEWFCGDHSDED